eukprot:TRINITY_DN401_c0_g1_i1.p1 TRINITY_DN401_c0_g1~~TRINITY_DN401_c0_g1_i1.p1  ORF type:complete len:120 (+),score=44.31 TRINITY_DN401_c0_g1_i1:30-362(+)
MALQVDANYQKVRDVIRKFGKPNAQFQQDLDISYGELHKHLSAVGGLGTVLKNMKQKKMVDYNDPFIKDGTIITLIADYNQDATPQGVTYDKIATDIKGEQTGHQKTSGW